MIKGTYQTEETKKKISEATKGEKNHNYNKYLSEEIRRKMIQAHKGISLSEETKQRMSESHKGKKNKPFSKETKQKMSEARKGIILSKETRIKMSEIHKGKHIGNNNNMWKGGITPENKKIRSGIEYRLWKEAVFARDNFTCQKCGVRGDKLNACHINSFVEFPELKFAIDNGITFCEKCHIEFHKIYSRNNNTKEQIKEFLGGQ